MPLKSQIPQDNALDSSLTLLFNPYKFISERRQRYQSDIFQARIMLQKTICMGGEEAVRLFYDTDRFTRVRAAPWMVEKILFGQGGIQGTDGSTHLSRKQLFMSLMTPERIEDLIVITQTYWHNYLKKWILMSRIEFLKEMQEILCQAICEWTGIPLQENEVKLRTHDLVALIEGSGSIGLRFWRGLIARNRTNRWISLIVEKTRKSEIVPKKDSPLYRFAFYRDPFGNELSKETTAVELINVLRPTIAVSYLITFAALELFRNPNSIDKISDGNNEYIENFVQEVRRLYTLLPFAIARVRDNFTWNGFLFTKGTRTLLDLFGTNRDPKIWSHPEEFDPQRFQSWNRSTFNFVAQGGGDHFKNHRCPGEEITISLMKFSLEFLVHSFRYDIPAQDLQVNFNRAPAIPRSGFVINHVRITEHERVAFLHQERLSS